MLKALQQRRAAGGNYFHVTEPVLNATGQPMFFCKAINKRSETYALNLSGQDNPDSALRCVQSVHLRSR